MKRFEIEEVRAREILNGKGNPTVEVDVVTRGGASGRASVPSGASVGKYEALELRDGGDRYGGKGVLGAVKNVNEILGPKLIGRDVRRQREIDQLMIELDGTANKSKLGANSILGVSLAVAKAASKSLAIPLYKYIRGTNFHILPLPMFVAMHGGKHVENELDFEDHIIMPVGAKSFSEALRMCMEVYYELGRVLSEKYGRRINTFVPPMKDEREALDTMVEAIEGLGYQKDFGIGLDVAASLLYNVQEEKYVLMGEAMGKEDLIEFYKDLVSTYPILSLEDPLNEDDFEGFSEITKRLDIQIVGDDIFVTNMKRLRKGIDVEAANALVLKVNQIGTLSEALDTAQIAFRNGYGVIVAARSGDTEDTAMADIAVGAGCGQLKAGPQKTEKWNRLLRIEEELGSSAKYPGKNFRQPQKTAPPSHIGDCSNSL